MSVVASAAGPAAGEGERRLAPWWPLVALIVLAAALRLATLGEQSFWYDEAFTPVHVLHASLGATLRAVVHHENTPPLWYLVAWADMRLFGDGAVALRLPSALAGIATVPVVWAICQMYAGRRGALIGAAIVAVNPLFVWYSQEARAYGLFVFMSALATLCFVRALQAPTRGRLTAFAIAGSLALLTHYFAVFLLIPMALWLLRDKARRRATLAAVAAVALVGLALLPLISAQGGHGTQWIGRWALSNRLQAIPQYFLTGYSGAPLGHGVELLVALPILAGAVLGAWRLRSATDLARLRRGALISLSIAASGVLAPIVLVAFGADYLAPRNLVGAMIPLTVLIAILLAAIDQDAGVAEPRALRIGGSALSRPGALLATTIVVAFTIVTLDVDLSPRLQRGNWRDVAHALGDSTRSRAITTVELGAAPLQYYLPALHNLARHSAVTVSEIDETGYAPLRRGAGLPPAPGFRLVDRRDVDGLILYRFVSSVPRLVSEAELRRHVITLAHPEVLVPSPARTAPAAASSAPSRSQMSSSDENI
jgi:mannosyltransferase